MILNIYSPKCKEVIPSLFVKLTSAPKRTKYLTISMLSFPTAENHKIINGVIGIIGLNLIVFDYDERLKLYNRNRN
jgi:hypothetical protein